MHVSLFRTMKALLFVLLCGVAAAAVVRVDQPVVAETESHASSKLTDFLKEAIENLVDRVKDTVDKVKDTAERLTDKVTELKEKLEDLGEKAWTKSEESVERLRQKVKNLVGDIEDTIKKQIKDISQDLDEAQYLRVRDILTVIKGRVSRRLDDLREYVKKAAVNNQVAKQVEALLDQLKDSDLADVFDNFLDISGHEVRHLKELYRQLKELAGQTDGILKERLNSFLDYVDIVYKRGVNQLVETYQIMKGNLEKVVDSTKDFSVDAVKDALRHLEEYKDHLGDLYAKLAKSLKEVIYKEPVE